MPIHLMGPNPLHINLMQSSLLAAGWAAADIQTPADAPALEAALALQPQATLVLDLGQGQDAQQSLAWLGDTTRRWPALQVVLLCTERSQTLLMQAMRSGAREVLDSPPEPAELERVLQRLAVHSAEKTALPPSGAQATVLAFVGSKGGCGSTLLASNLAWLLATEFERDCAFVDLDWLHGDGSFYLGAGQARHSLDQLVQQGPRLDAQLLRSSLHPVHPRLRLLAAPSAPHTREGLSAAALLRVLSLARQQHQVLVLDVPRQLDELALQALTLADQVCVVLRNRVPDVRNAQQLLRWLPARGVPAQRLQPLLNREGEADGLDRAAIDRALQPAIVHTVANDSTALRACVHLGLPLHEQAPNSPVLRDLRRLASQSLDLPLPRRHSWLGRWLGKAAA
jgi:pilus assembly protein CpaE